ncbi:hypothetical protein K449DRAFT_467617 [Hypoxylon sp. EC38]|nr:hypothetical protein K449DRAFT_467617 [Hypoxylon sp. EC38]
MHAGDSRVNAANSPSVPAAYQPYVKVYLSPMLDFTIGWMDISSAHRVRSEHEPSLPELEEARTLEATLATMVDSYSPEYLEHYINYTISISETWKPPFRRLARHIRLILPFEQFPQVHTGAAVVSAVDDWRANQRTQRVVAERKADLDGWGLKHIGLFAPMEDDILIEDEMSIQDEGVKRSIERSTSTLTTPMLATTMMSVLLTLPRRRGSKENSCAPKCSSTMIMAKLLPPLTAARLPPYERTDLAEAPVYVAAQLLRHILDTYGEALFSLTIPLDDVSELMDSAHKHKNNRPPSHTTTSCVLSNKVKYSNVAYIRHTHFNLLSVIVTGNDIKKLPVGWPTSNRRATSHPAVISPLDLAPNLQDGVFQLRGSINLQLRFNPPPSLPFAQLGHITVRDMHHGGHHGNTVEIGFVRCKDTISIAEPETYQPRRHYPVISRRFIRVGGGAEYAMLGQVSALPYRNGACRGLTIIPSSLLLGIADSIKEPRERPSLQRAWTYLKDAKKKNIRLRYTKRASGSFQDHCNRNDDTASDALEEG